MDVNPTAPNLDKVLCQQLTHCTHELVPREYTPEFSDSVSNLSAFQCRLFPSVFDALVRGVFRPRIFGRRYSSASPGSRQCLFKPCKLSSDLGDPRGVDWLIINRRQDGLNLFCATTCAVGYAGEVLEFDVSRLLGRVFSACGVLSQRSYSDVSAMSPMCNR